MFSGIVEELGTVRDRTPLEGGFRIRVAATAVLEGLDPGDSIAVDGVCQTVVERVSDAFVVEAIGTTLSRTTFAELVPGRAVNLERALALGDRIGGHLVQGHVDGTGTVESVERAGEHVLLRFTMPPVVADVTVLHGSITVNGVSLTVNGLPRPDVAEVALIPYTWDHTNLGDLQAGNRVNLEGDMLGKFVAHLLERRQGAGRPTEEGDHAIR